MNLLCIVAYSFFWVNFSFVVYLVKIKTRSGSSNPGTARVDSLLYPSPLLQTPTENNPTDNHKRSLRCGKKVDSWELQDFQRHVVNSLDFSLYHASQT